MFSTFNRRKLLRCLAGLGLVPGAALSQVKEGAGADPVLAKGGTVLVRFSSLLRAGPVGRLLARITFPETSVPVLGPKAHEAGHHLLWKLVFEGRAAGNHGDLYENRDRGHSRLPPEAHPQLTHVAYDAEAREAGLDYGLAGPVLFDAPLIGNSSTAVKAGPLWRSLPRLALGQPGGAQHLYQNYLAGQIHVYPEHRDHDPEHGDLIPANTPYFLISQGSSGSDRPHLEALAMILAAFRPETKAFLYRNQLLAPTVQMVLRRSLTAVRSRSAYLSGLAHPSVIPRDQINLMRMVQLANALTPETVPPMVRLAVLSEEDAVEGIDYFGEGLSERLFDTPAAIARIWRSHAYRRSMTVSAEATRDRVDLIRFTIGHLRVGAIDRACRGHQHMRRWIGACGLNQLVGADQVGLKVIARGLNRMAHAGLSGQMDHQVRAVFGKQIQQQAGLFQLAMHRHKGLMRHQLIEPVLF